MTHLHTCVRTSLRSAAAATTLALVAALAAFDRAKAGDEGQATAEYALVLLGAAAIALAVISWATRTNLVGRLLDTVFGGLLKHAL